MGVSPPARRPFHSRGRPKAERAALIASVGGIDNLDSFWGRRDKTRQQRDRESRAAERGRRPRPDGFAGCSSSESVCIFTPSGVQDYGGGESRVFKKLTLNATTPGAGRSIRARAHLSALALEAARALLLPLPAHLRRRLLVARRAAAAGDVQQQVDGRAVRELVVLERARREVAAAEDQALDVRGDEGLVLR